MKFYCDSCGAKYLIGDDKVQGKILRIRCKKCDHVIVVRELASPTPSLDASASVDSGALSQAAPGPVWYYSRNGESFGPMPLEDIRGRIRAHTLGDDIHLWHESFTQWKPARECAELADLFQAPSARKAHNPTISLSVQDIHNALEQQRAASVEPAEPARPALRDPNPKLGGGLGGPGGASAEILRRASLTRGAERGSAILSKPAEPVQPAVSIQPAASAQPAASIQPAASVQPAVSVQPAAQEARGPLRSTASSLGLSRPAHVGAESGQPLGGAEPSQDRIRALRERLKGTQAAPLKPGGSALRDRLRPPGEVDEPTLPKAGASGLHELRALDREVSRFNAQLPPSQDDPPTEELKRPYTAEVMIGIGGVSSALSGVSSLGQRHEPAKAEPPKAEPAVEVAPARVEAPPSDATVVGVETPFYEPDAVEPEGSAEPAGASSALLEMPPTVELSASAMEAALSSVERPAAVVPAPVAEAALPVLELQAEPKAGAGLAEHEVEHDFFSQAEPKSDDAQGMFDLAELAKNPPPISSTGLFGAVPQAAHEGSALRPMSASAQASVAKEEGHSASLLIQLDKLQKAQRSRNMLVGAGIAALLLLVGVSVFIVVTYTKDEKRQQEEAVFQPPRAPGVTSGVDKPKGYSPEQLSALKGSQPNTKPAEVPTQDPNQDQAPPVDKKVTPPVKVGVAGGEAKPPTEKVGEAPPKEKEGEKPGELVRGTDLAYDPLKGNTSELMGGGAVGHTRIEGREKDAASDNSAPVEGSLSKEEIAEGFGNVRNSVTQCLERHLKREGTLPKGKVKLALTVVASGEVTGVGIDPEVQDTLFFNCLQSHRTRWKFKAFSGSPLQLTKSFVLQ